MGNLMDLVIKLIKMGTSILGNTKKDYQTAKGDPFTLMTPNGQGTETLPNGHLVGEYKDGKPWNAKGYDKESNIIAKWVNGVKQE